MVLHLLDCLRRLAVPLHVDQPSGLRILELANGNEVHSRGLTRSVRKGPDQGDENASASDEAEVLESIAARMDEAAS